MDQLKESLEHICRETDTEYAEQIGPLVRKMDAQAKNRYNAAKVSYIYPTLLLSDFGGIPSVSQSMKYI